MMPTLVLSSPASQVAPSAFPPTPTQFLRSWFSHCPPDQYIELRAIHATTGTVKQEFHTPDAPDILVDDGFRLVDEFDVYFGVCPRIRPRGDKASVTHAPGLWADVDFKRFEDGEAGALRTLGEFRLPPTWIIGTGGGFHCYWALTAPARADANFERKLKGVARSLNADPAATDVSRVLRVPGTWHVKRDFQVRILSWPPTT